MRPTEIIDLVAGSEVAAHSRVERVYRALRQNGVIKQKGRGRYATSLGLEDLSMVLIGSALPLPVEDAGAAVRAIAMLELRESKLEGRVPSPIHGGDDMFAKHMDTLPATIAQHLDCAAGPIRSLSEVLKLAAEHRVFALTPEPISSGHFEPQYTTSDVTFIVTGGPALTNPRCQIRCVYRSVGHVIIFFGETEDTNSFSGFTKRWSRSVHVSVAIGVDSIHYIASKLRTIDASADAGPRMRGWNKRKSDEAQAQTDPGQGDG
jgi:hypothetical protein